MPKFLKNIFTPPEPDPNADEIAEHERKHLNHLHNQSIKLAGAYTLKLITDYKKPRSTMINLKTGKFI